MTITKKGTHYYIGAGEPGVGKSSIMRSIFRRTLWQRFVDWLTGAPKKYGLTEVDAVEADVGDVALPSYPYTSAMRVHKPALDEWADWAEDFNKKCALRDDTENMYIFDPRTAHTKFVAPRSVTLLFDELANAEAEKKNAT